MVKPSTLFAINIFFNKFHSFLLQRWRFTYANGGSWNSLLLWGRFPVLKLRCPRHAKEEDTISVGPILACTGSHSRPHVPGVGTPVTGLHSVPVLPASTVYCALENIPEFSPYQFSGSWQSGLLVELWFHHQRRLSALGVHSNQRYDFIEGIVASVCLNYGVWKSHSLVPKVQFKAASDCFVPEWSTSPVCPFWLSAHRNCRRSIEAWSK